MIYDVVIIGAGVSGLFAADSLIKNTKIKVLVVDKGDVFENRICPMQNKGISQCLGCKVCHRLYGCGGLLKSEGKFNYTNDFGGKLGSKIGDDKALKLMKEVDEILCNFEGDKIQLYNTYNKELVDKTSNSRLEVLSTEIRHLGSRLSNNIIEKMYDYLKNYIDFKFLANILDIKKENNLFKLYFSNRLIKSKKVVLATGNNGGQFFRKLCDKFDIDCAKTRVDIGIRVEMKENQLNSILKDSFETKLRYKGDNFQATTYCMNLKGSVIKKYQNGLTLADGQNYLEENSLSQNLNFTLFVPRYFNSTIKAKDYATKIVKRINQDKSRIVIQRYGDLRKKIKSSTDSIKNNSITPTLNAEVGNLYDEIPNIYVDALLESFIAIEELLVDKISADTLLYGVDVKFYEGELDISVNFESSVKNLYFIGDCSGLTWSLSQAAANGLYFGSLF